IGLTYWSFTHTPTGFIPSQDKGYLLVNVQLPDAASVERTEEVMRSVEDFVRFEWEKVELGADFPWGRPATPDDAWRLRREFAAAAGLVIDDTKREFYRKVQREGQDDLLVPVSLNTPLPGLGATERDVWKARQALATAAGLFADDDEKAIYQKTDRKREGVAHTVTTTGQSLLLNANAPNFGSMYVMLDAFEERRGPELSGEALAARLEERLRKKVPGATVHIFGAPPVEGLGTAGGFKLIIEDRGDSPLRELQGVSERVMAKSADSGEVTGLYTSFRANTPWLSIDYDRRQGLTENVPFSELGAALAGYLGSLYVND